MKATVEGPFLAPESRVSPELNEQFLVANRIREIKASPSAQQFAQNSARKLGISKPAEWLDAWFHKPNIKFKMTPAEAVEAGRHEEVFEFIEQLAS